MNFIKKLTGLTITVRFTDQLVFPVFLFFFKQAGIQMGTASQNQVIIWRCPCECKSAQPMAHEICSSDRRLHQRHQSSRLIWLGR